MFSKCPLLMTCATVLALAACGASTSTVTSSNSPNAVATAHPTATATPSATAIPAGGTASPAPGSIDPCTLMTLDEVKLVSGLSTAPGETTQIGNGRKCAFRAGTNELNILLKQGVDAAGAKAYYEADKAQIPSFFHITELPTFDDGALIARGAAGTVGIAAIFVLDSANLFEVECQFIPTLPSSACSDDQLKGGAIFVAGKL